MPKYDAPDFGTRRWELIHRAAAVLSREELRGIGDLDDTALEALIKERETAPKQPEPLSLPEDFW
jgi:hypothetical protein